MEFVTLNRCPQELLDKIKLARKDGDWIGQFKLIDSNENFNLYEYDRFLIRVYKWTVHVDEIESLLKLQKTSYYQRVFAYKHGEFVVLGKAKGELISKLIRMGEQIPEKIFHDMERIVKLTVANGVCPLGLTINNVYYNPQTRLLTLTGSEKYELFKSYRKKYKFTKFFDIEKTITEAFKESYDELVGVVQ